MKPLKGGEAIHNSLFKNILFSFFPQSFQIGKGKISGLEPASLFISFISARQFFSVVNRKILENFKLNLFDISIDPFEAKIGFGDTPYIKVKEIDNYYSYCSVANMNGFKHFNPGLMGLSLSTLFIANIPNNIFEDNNEDNTYFSQFALTTYLLSFIMYARIKVFPYKTKKRNFNWFIELYFGLYEILLQKIGFKYTKKKLTLIKKEIVKEVGLFFALFYSYQRINKALDNNFLSNTELYNWLFYHELKNGKFKELIKDFIKISKTTNKLSSFSVTEKYIIDIICPADFFVRYIMSKKEIFLSSRTICKKIFYNKKIDKYLKSFLKDDTKREEFFKYILSQKILKDNFFDGVKEYMFKKYKTNTNYNYNEEKELDEFFSSVGDIEEIDDIENISVPTIPKKIKEEANSMELFINYYINIVGGMGVSRGDGGFIRLFRKGILEDLLNENNIFDKEDISLHYYGNLLYIYTKNIFYYKYAYDNIRNGKGFFQLPFNSNIKEIHSNLYLINLFNENAISTLLQDLTDFELKIYIKNKKILDTFIGRFGEKISNITHMKNKDILKFSYEKIDIISGKEFLLLETLYKYIKNDDIHNLKLRLYSFDFWLIEEVYAKIIENGRGYNQTYKNNEGGTLSVLGKLSILKETFFGFCIYMTYLIKKGLDKEQLKIILNIYTKEILLIQKDTLLFMTIFTDILKIFDNILIYWTKLDNNEIFLSYGLDNWINFWNKIKEKKDTLGEIRGEDLLWFRGYLKNISYYNKRFLIPKI